MAKLKRTPDESGSGLPVDNSGAAAAEGVVKRPRQRSRRAPVTPPAAAPAPLVNVNAAGDTAEKPAKVRSKRKIRAPRPDDSSKRDSLRTVDERLKELPELPSLKTPAAPDRERPVDTDAPPPPPPTPPAEAQPLPTELIDRGAPVPTSYGLDRLVILPRDPHWLFTYWELKGGALERLRFKYSAEVVDNSRWVLRVRTLKDFSLYNVDIDVRIGQWYLKVLPDNRYALELGFYDHEGHFVLVIQGNEVRTPRATVSEIVDERWIILREELEKLLQAGGAEAVAQAMAHRPSSENTPRLVRSEQPRAFQVFSSYLLQKKTD